MRVVLHMGLHKTATSSFQMACRRAQQSLAEAGILYPSSPAGAQFTDNHSDLAHRVSSGELEEAKSYLERCRADAEANHCSSLLISSEDFCLLFDQTSKLTAFATVLDGLFSETSYILVLRDVRSLVPSGLKQRLVHCGAALFGPELTVDFGRHLRMAKALQQALGPRLSFASFEELSAGGRFCNGLLARCMASTGPWPDLDECVENVGGRFGDQPSLFLTPVLRAAVALVEGENPYAAKVDERLAGLVDMTVLERAFRGHDALVRCEELVDRAVAMVCERAYGEQRSSIMREFSDTQFVSLLVPGEFSAEETVDTAAANASGHGGELSHLD